MFVLQDCSICFEDYDALRIPHSISCGHVFCRPCLDSLVTSAPNCPNCRASFGRKSIRKVVCAHQDSPTLDASTLSEAEMMMWQEIESAVESADKHEQRKSLARDNSQQAVREAGFSKNMLVALDVMRLLVQIESKNDRMGAALAIEESLRDRVTFLETQLSMTKATFSANIQDFQTFLSKMQQLESSIGATDETQSQSTDRLTSTNPLSTSPNIHNSPPTHVRSAWSQEKTPNPLQQTKLQPQSALSGQSQLSRASPSAATFTEPTHPPLLSMAQSSGPSVIRTRGPSEHSPPAPVPENAQIRTSPPSSQHGRPVQTEPPLVGSFRELFGEQQSILASRRQSVSSARTSTQRTIKAARDYRPRESDELSLISGETVRLVHEWHNIDDGREWIYCWVRGIQGLVPRDCLNVTNGS